MSKILIPSTICYVLLSETSFRGLDMNPVLSFSSPLEELLNVMILLDDCCLHYKYVTVRASHCYDCTLSWPWMVFLSWIRCCFGVLDPRLRCNPTWTFKLQEGEVQTSATDPFWTVRALRVGKHDDPLVALNLRRWNRGLVFVVVD